MPKKQPQPASYWLYKLGDNERKYVEANSFRIYNEAASMYAFPWYTFSVKDKQCDPIAIELIERYKPKI